MTDKERYISAAHAMQSGVAAELEMDFSSATGKHLRVGINVAMSDMGGLTALLIAKGLFTEAEYVKAVADAMEREVRSYEEKLSARLGRPVKLA
jgi:hypothetical protein